MKFAATAIAFLALTTSAVARQDMSAEGAWARATTPKAQTGAVYLTIVDKGAADTLTSVSTPVAAKAKLHETVKTGDVVGMRPVDALPISTTGPTVLAPGGYHIMLFGLKKPLVKGETFPITLNFAKRGAVNATVKVEAAGAGGPMQDMGSGHDMDSMSGASKVQP